MLGEALGRQGLCGGSFGVHGASVPTSDQPHGPTSARRRGGRHPRRTRLGSAFCQLTVAAGLGTPPRGSGRRRRPGAPLSRKDGRGRGCESVGVFPVLLLRPHSRWSPTLQELIPIQRLSQVLIRRPASSVGLPGPLGRDSVSPAGGPRPPCVCHFSWRHFPTGSVGGLFSFSSKVFSN